MTEKYYSKARILRYYYFVSFVEDETNKVIVVKETFSFKESLRFTNSR